MAEETQKAPVPQMPIFIDPPNGVPNFYSNNVAVSPTNFDLRMVFGEMVGSLNGRIQVAQRVGVTISWVEAKILARFIQDHVEAHEKANGILKYPVLGTPVPTNPFTEGIAPPDWHEVNGK